jgi:choline dehydrogenase-like flavoprotein
MKTSAVGFTFKEVMAGGFALGPSDPSAGEAAGRAAGTTLTMHATIVIDDLDKFFADALHPGSISGQIDYPPFGVHLPSTNGVFRLFSPTEDLAMKYMVYELGFNAGGASYYMAGHKEVKRASVIDMWHATTTLYTQLHKGSDATTPVVGAGIISLSVHDLLGMIPTLKALNASSPEQAASALTKFGRFFFGELWDTYISKFGA